MDQMILPFEWHSFCISINIEAKEATLVHNGHIQLIQQFHEPETDTLHEFKFMTSGHIGGAKFEGILLDFEAFGRPLPDEDIIQWTLCQSKGGTSFLHFRICNPILLPLPCGCIIKIHLRVRLTQFVPQTQRY